jgi:hypothetical protein
MLMTKAPGLLVFRKRAIYMTTAHKDLKPAWIKHIPRSKMHYPRGLTNKAKYVFWRAYTPCHPLVRGAAHKLGLDKRMGVVKHEGRQRYLLGYIAPHVSMQEFVEHIVAQGFAKLSVAWKDEGELLSLRRVDNFTHQYHIRIFNDGEVRGHYEYTPECYPYAHLKAVGQYHHAKEFAALFGDFITNERP